MELSVPLLSLLRQGEFHIVSAYYVFKRMALHFGNKSAERFSKQNQILLFPALRFLEVFGFASLCGERTSRELYESIEYALGIVTVGNALKDFAKVARMRLLFHLWKVGKRTAPDCAGIEVDMNAPVRFNGESLCGKRTRNPS